MKVVLKYISDQNVHVIHSAQEIISFYQQHNIKIELWHKLKYKRCKYWKS